MSLIGDLWLAWLLIGIACYTYVLLNQANRIIRIFSEPVATATFESFTQGLKSFVLVGFAGTVSFVLFAVAIIINIAN